MEIILTTTFARDWGTNIFFNTTSAGVNDVKSTWLKQLIEAMKFSGFIGNACGKECG